MERSTMKQGDYVLLAWINNESVGGMNDCCGWFDSVNAALDFFNDSSHCEGMDNYQIVDTDSWETVEEGSR